MACECCRYHGTEDAYRNEPVVDNEQVHALLLYDNGLAVYLPDPLSGVLGDRGGDSRPLLPALRAKT
jgi:hypothetical protein